MIAALVLVGLFAVAADAQSNSGGGSNQTPWYLVIGTGVATSLITFAVSTAVAQMWFKPWLKIEYDENSKFCRVDYIQKHNSVYLRLRVVNGSRSAAKYPRVYLMDVEVQDAGNWKRTDYCDILPLSWAYERSPENRVRIPPRSGSLPLLKDTPDYADICYITKDGVKLGLLVDPYDKYKGLIEKDRVYRLSLQAVAEDAGPASKQYLLQWHGTPESLRVWPQEPSA